MDRARPANPSPGSHMPWFRGRPQWALTVAAALYVVVFGLRLSTGGPEDAINMLYALPIALVALSFGRTAGIAAGVVGVVLVVAWVAIEDVELSPIGWGSRILPLLLLGGVLGDAADRIAAADARQHALEAAAQRQRDAAEVNDTLIQGMAAAKWAIEAGRYDSGLATLTETIQVGHQLVSKLLREADMGVDGHRPTSG